MKTRYLAFFTPAGRRNALLVFSLAILTACVQTPIMHSRSSGQQFIAPSFAIPQVAEADCAGDIVAPYGLQEVNDDALLTQAKQPAGKGGLCKAKSYQVKQALTVYRVWDASNTRGEYGRWWSFTPPTGSAATYRQENAICPEWSGLNKVKQCRLKVGEKIVVGPGQSAQCANNLSYPQSPANQVFVPNDTRDSSHPKLAVENCLADAEYP